MKKTWKIVLVLLVSVSVMAGCQQNSSELKEAQNKIADLEAQLAKAYTPGWGAMMRNAIQIHHSNLWFAGEANNWDLAEHMVEELEESFESLEEWYPDDEETAAMPMIEPSLKLVAEAIEKEDLNAFKEGFLTLTSTCNACHVATGHPIYVIQVPTQPGLTNQSFASEE